MFHFYLAKEQKEKNFLSWDSNSGEMRKFSRDGSPFCSVDAVYFDVDIIEKKKLISWLYTAELRMLY